MIYINDDEVLEISLTMFYTFATLANTYYSLSNYNTDNIECCRTNKINKVHLYLLE